MKHYGSQPHSTWLPFRDMLVLFCFRLAQIRTGSLHSLFCVRKTRLFLCIVYVILDSERSVRASGAIRINAILY